MTDTTNIHTAPIHTATTLEVTGGVAWLTLSRPQAANSRNQQMRTELSAHYDRLVDDPDAKVLVLTGVGDRFFCAGMDLKEAAGRETLLERRARLGHNRDIEHLASLPLPTIAAINGMALGGGLEMALACDLRYAADTARLGLPEVAHGLIPGGGATVRLPRLIGPAAAAHMIFTGDPLTAEEGLDVGLVNEVTTPQALTARVRAVASHIAGHPRSALRMAKESLVASRDLPTTAATQAELDRLLMLLDDRSAT